MINRLRSIWIWGASGALILLGVPLVVLVWLFERDRRHIRTARLFRGIGPLIAKVNPWRLHIAGAERIDHRQAYVVVSNHQSFADIPLISHLRMDTKWLAKAELFRVPGFGWMMSLAGDIPVVRADRRKAAQALLQCASYLRKHVSVVFFPEGTRSRDGAVLPFNDGPFQLAIREKVPVLPLAIEGSGAALPRNSWLFGPAQDIHLSVLEPVAVNGWAARRCAELRELVRERIIQEVERIRQDGRARTPPTPGTERTAS